ncbi:MAG TPA: NeuD/PglB/VioB family sugar acetyltransferase [Polyangiaceae bacterium]|nr:NeuD/PglB/VioB family sugar acetyltransferase [Polyangiaceae bacterium]
MPSENPARLIVFGAGGHGRVVADAARAAGFSVLGFLDDAPHLAGTERDGLRIFGGFAWLADKAGLGVALGVGANAAREVVATRVRAAGLQLVSIVHPSAVVSPYAGLAEGSVVLAAAVVNTGARIGIGAIVNSGAVVEHDATVGDFAHVSPNATLSGAAAAGARSHVGAAACILPERVLGERSILGAGGVLVTDVPARSVAVGVPARVVRAVSEFGS